MKILRKSTLALVVAALPLLFAAADADAGASYQLQIPTGGGNTGNGAGATNKFLVLQIDSVGGTVNNLGLANTCPAGGQTAPFLVNGPGTPFDATANLWGMPYYQWFGPYYDPTTGTSTPATVCVPAKATDSLASSSYTAPVYSSDQYVGGTAVFSGIQALSPQNVNGVLLRVTTTAGTYRIHVLSAQYSKCADGSTSCGSQTTGFDASTVNSIGATLEASGAAAADYTFQMPYVPYGTGAATGTASVAIPASAITTLQ